MSSSLFKNVMNKLYVYKSYIICIKRIWQEMTNKVWYAIKPNQTKLINHIYNNLIVRKQMNYGSF